MVQKRKPVDRESDTRAACFRLGILLVNARSNSGDTPLRVAVLHGRKNVAEWLRHLGGQDDELAA